MKKKRKYTYLITFLTTLIIMGIIYAIKKVSPLGPNSLLTVDFYHQYGPLLGEYHDRVFNLSSFIYSFNSGLGIPLFRNFANYLASPFNLIILFFKKTSLLTSYSFLIGLKPCLAATFTVYYLNKKFNKDDYTFIPLGILYGLSAYFIAYYWNIMWTDGMVFIPLITLGIENIVNNKNYKLYPISLGLMLISNYFIGYMLCIYSVIYFISYMIIKTEFKKKNIKDILLKIFKFSYLSLLAGGLAAILLIPLYSAISSISATTGSWPTSQYYAISFMDFIKGHLTGIYVTVFASDPITNPNVACGILTVFMALLFMFNKKINIKRKVVYFTLLFIFVLIFFIPQLDFIMQAFHVPNDLPYRYSFIYSFILIIIGSYSINYIKDTKYYFIIAIYIILMLLLGIMAVKDNWSDITRNIIFINMIILLLYLIFISYIYYAKNNILFYQIALILIAAIEVLIPLIRNWNIDQNIKGFYSEYDAKEKLLSEIKNNETDLFYRYEEINNLTLNDGAWYGYNAMTTFSSMAYENMAVLQNKLGMPGNYINSYYYVEQTPIYDMMFDIKYIEGDHLDKKRYSNICYSKCINKFDYTLGLGYAVNKRINNWYYIQDNPFDIQNDFIEKATGVADTLEYLEINDVEEVYYEGEKTIVKYTLDNPRDMLYFYHNDYLIDFFIIGNTLYYNNDDYEYINNYNSELYYSLDDYNEKRIVGISSDDDEIVIYVGYNNYIRDGFLLYGINNNKFMEAYNILNKEKLNITKYKEDTIIANINALDDKTVYTSIPYDEGWHVYVDNEEIDVKVLANNFVSFDIKKGKHDIKIKYQIPHILLSTCISVISVLLLIFDTFLLKNKKRVK